ncbi:hypothetical protein CYY_003909, partial [Polysphondylium violaceum]
MNDISRNLSSTSLNDEPIENAKMGKMEFPKLSTKKTHPLVLPCYDNRDNGTGKDLQAKVFRQNTRHSNGGWKFIDEPELKKQRGVCWELVKSVGNSIIEGKELTNTTLPISLFEPRSFLEKLSDTWGYSPIYLNQAANCKDPLERFKLVIAFTISGLHLTQTLTKPFNPLLGETFEGSFSDGSNAFCEQTSHHPPISHWEVVDQENRFKFYGYANFSARCLGNVVKGNQKGPLTIEFEDGTKITWTFPEVLIKGIFWGDRVTEFSGKITFTDEKNKLGCDVLFNPNALGFVKSLFSKQKEPSDVIQGTIYKLESSLSSSNGVSSKKSSSSNSNNNSNTICKIEGSWLTELIIDNIVYWNIKMQPSGIIYKENPLPTDCRYREDLKYLKEGNIEKAKEFKELIEDKQRSEAKIRKEGIKKDSKSKKDKNNLLL